MGTYKVKMLENDYQYDLQKDINTWLSNNKVEVLNINHSAYSFASKIYYSALIFYIIHN